MYKKIPLTLVSTAYFRLTRRGVKEKDRTLRRVYRPTDWLDAGALDSYRPSCKTSEMF